MSKQAVTKRMKEVLEMIGRILPAVPEIGKDDEGKNGYKYRVVKGEKEILMINHSKNLIRTYKVGGQKNVDRYCKAIFDFAEGLYGKSKLIAS